MSIDSDGLLSGEEHSEYYCPITCQLMGDPVVCADGTSYDRTAIETWLLSHNTSPLTGSVLPHKNLIPNLSLRALVREYRASHGDAPRRRSAPRQTVSAPAPIVRDDLVVDDEFPPVVAMTIDVARRCLINHVSSGWTTDTTAATQCEIRSCLTVKTIVTRIESFIETRERVAKRVPYSTGLYSARTDGTAPEVWDMRCPARPMFQHNNEEIEIPFTSHLETCEVCQGSGVTDCKVCSGSDWKTCGRCNSKAPSGGRCPDCLGTGIIKCDNVLCERGRAQCADCLGSGKQRHYVVLLRKHYTITNAKCTGTTISDRDLSESHICNAAGVALYTDEAPFLVCPRNFTGEVSRNLFSVENDSAHAIHKVSATGGRLLRQRVTVKQVPITIAKAEHQGNHFHWYIYGTDNAVAAFDYPNNCCECCNRCVIF